jgi:hypothetical protein
MVLDAICSTVPAEMITALTSKDFESEAWEIIKMMRISNERIHKASAHKVRREYELKQVHGDMSAKSANLEKVVVMSQNCDLVEMMSSEIIYACFC